MVSDIQVSIIIPTYNSAQYISELLSSINKYVRQIRAEVLVVDDGSEDQTIDLVKSFHFNQNISSSIILLKHSGVSRARNIGIEHARGRFLTFFDSDDKLDSFFDQKQFKDFDDDIISFYDNKKINNNSLKLINYNNLDEKYLLIMGMLNDKNSKYYGLYSMGPYKKLFKKAFIMKKHIRFDEDCKWWEDLLFNLSCILKAGKVKFINYTFYKQRVNMSSVSHNLSSSIIKTALMVVKKTEPLIGNMKVENRHNILMRERSLFFCTVFIGYFINNKNPQLFKQFKSQIEFNYEMIDFVSNPQSKALIFSVNFFGYNFSRVWYKSLKVINGKVSTTEDWK